ncbi:hypothetical protein Mpet_1418 [Methanolacinia petrolearia DSM 11571]|uniref:Uncharacterized protein n=1 Tax=Methanolacinia petrolearia (strain DSM 11571 / OCM 486 / SEBR 4847) TaxID=679926 RepID=E1RFE8_METP4|nr:hypothetical protein Mpet_1418 [Methanolacinia petrolearia DSM 11571]
MTGNIPYHPAYTGEYHKGFFKLLFCIATVNQNENKFSRGVF